MSKTDEIRIAELAEKIVAHASGLTEDDEIKIGALRAASQIFQEAVMAKALRASIFQALNPRGR